MKSLKELREASDLSQFKAANRAGLDRTRLSLAESGHVVLTAKEQDALRRVLLSALRKRVARLQNVLAQVDPRQHGQPQQQIGA